MHAASVHPEPGSNSLKILYPRDLSHQYLIFRVSLTFFFFTLLGLCFLLEFSRFSHTILSYILVLNSLILVVQFSMTYCRAPLGADLSILPHFISACQYFFKKFFEVFLNSLPFSLISTASFRAALLVYHLLFPLVNTFFKVFCGFRLRLAKITYNLIINLIFYSYLYIKGELS